ncbi:MAG: hypothetical protein U5K31_15195 [Balneolaceae bacterium]|nr:hypothetical protein [Balneolaceae bacterium]
MLSPSRLEREDRVYDRVIFPDSSHFAAPVEIRTRQQFKVTGFRDSLSYRLQFFGTADTTLPRLPVRLVSGTDTTTLYTNPVPLRFRSVLASQEESFRPLKPIFDFAAAWWPWILGLLIAGAAAWYLWRMWRQGDYRRKKEGRAPFRATPFRDPLTELRDTLRQLEKASLQNKEDFEQFYINLGDAIRAYFEELYEITALEMTSGEILQALREEAVDRDLVGATRDVLNEADLVKFARFEPTVEQSKKALSKGYAFLERAQQIDGPRIEKLRRKHHEEMEEARRRYEEQAREEHDGQQGDGQTEGAAPEQETQNQEEKNE